MSELNEFLFTKRHDAMIVIKYELEGKPIYSIGFKAPHESIYSGFARKTLAIEDLHYFDPQIPFVDIGLTDAHHQCPPVFYGPHSFYINESTVMDKSEWWSVEKGADVCLLGHYLIIQELVKQA